MTSKEVYTITLQTGHWHPNKRPDVQIRIRRRLPLIECVIAPVREKKMNPFDILFWGWYQISDRTIYSLAYERDVIGPRVHSYFVTFLVHGINVWTFVSYLVAKYLGVGIPLYVSLFLALLIFGIGYLIYLRGSRASKIIMSNVNTAKAVFFVVLSLTYVVVSIYLMFKVGNYTRFQLGNVCLSLLD